MYVIFSNATLADMARRRPQTMEEFLSVSGVGAVKARKYGAAFLAVLARRRRRRYDSMTWTLRPWRMSDAGALAALLQDGRVRRMLRDGLPYPYTEADARAFLAETLASDPEEVFAFAIAQEDIPVGSLGMFRQGNIHRRTAELGYYLGPDHWGQGIGTWAVPGGGSMGLCRTDLLRIFAEPFAENHASCRVLEKAGFQLEGVLRQNAVKDGRVLDMKMYARCRGRK